MTSATFNKIVEEQFQRCHDVLFKKGQDYSSDNDRLSNFKELAPLIGVSVLCVWAVYFMKHITAILSFVGKGRVESEPIDGRIDDAINYLLLLKGLVVEGREGA